MQIFFNGVPSDVPEGSCVSDLLAREGLGERRIAVEVNACVVPRSAHDTHRLAEGDRVEVVHALGGG